MVACGCSPHVQLHRGVQPGRGGPWGREDRARQGNQRDLVCRVHPVKGRRSEASDTDEHPPAQRHTGELDPGGGSQHRLAPQVLTEGPGSPGKPLSPLCPGRPTTPRWPAIPWGPGVPGAPCGDKRHLRVVVAAGATLPVEGTAEGCRAWGEHGAAQHPQRRGRGPTLGGVTYDGAVSARRALLARGARGASGAGLTGAASGTSFTTGSFATFLPAGAGGAGEADVSLGAGGGNAVRQQPGTPPAAS